MAELEEDDDDASDGPGLSHFAAKARASFPEQADMEGVRRFNFTWLLLLVVLYLLLFGGVLYGLYTVVSGALGWSGRALLWAFTWSRDSTYEAAALDASTTPKVIVIALGFATVAGLLIVTVGKRFGMPAQGSLAGAALKAAIAVFAALTGGGVYGVSSQAGYIRKHFESNLAILAPALSDEEEEEYAARFAAVRSKADFTALDENMQARSKKAKRVLRSADALW